LIDRQPYVDNPLFLHISSNPVNNINK
jgi:hypothetical protein